MHSITITAFTKDTLYNLWARIGLVRIVYQGVGKREFSEAKAGPSGPGGQKLSVSTTFHT
jgi:hypothetical protein